VILPTIFKNKPVNIKLIYFKLIKVNIKMSDNITQHIIDALPVLIAYVGNDQKYRFVNDEYQKYLGIAIDSIIGKNIQDVLGPERYKLIEGHVKTALLGKGVTYEALMPSNQTFFARYIPFINDDKIVDGFSVLVEDITESKLLELERTNLVDELQKALDEIKTLKGVIPICSYCHSIRDEDGACPTCLVKARVEAGLIDE
jgi:PAS domain S-box-containing protein